MTSQFDPQTLLALETLRGPLRYDSGSQVVLDYKGEVILDLRGWGYIQYMSQAANRQDAIGELIADLLNKELAKLVAERIFR